jgi:hypothetical protein
MPEPLGRLLAAGNVADVFEYGAGVAKLYRSPAAKPAAFREAASHATVAALGLPLPAIWGVRPIDGRWAIIFERVSAPSFADQMRAGPGDVTTLLECMIRLQLQIHDCSTSQLPDLKPRLVAQIANSALIDASRKHALLAGLKAMPEGDHVCHGDFHPLNILGRAGDPVVIDWADAARGAAPGDVCRSYLLLRLDAEMLAAPYLDGYCRIGGLAAAAALDWLPYMAAAKLAEQVPGEQEKLLQVLATC